MSNACRAADPRFSSTGMASQRKQAVIELKRKKGCDEVVSCLFAGENFHEMKNQSDACLVNPAKLIVSSTCREDQLPYGIRELTCTF